MTHPTESTRLLRAETDKGFESISRDLLQRTDLSFRARGILAWMLSLPQGWTIHGIPSIQQAGTEGREAISTALGELESAHLLARLGRRAPGGKGWEWLWVYGWDPVAVDKLYAEWVGSPDTVLESVVREPVGPSEQAEQGVSAGGSVIREPGVPEAVGVRDPLSTGSDLEEEPPPLRGDPPQRKDPRGTRLPEAFSVTDGMTAWARQNVPQVDPEAEFERFRDYWCAQPGARGRKADWNATWRNWMRKAAEDVSRPGRSPVSGISKRDRTVLGWQAMKTPQPPAGPQRPALPGGGQRELDS